MVYTYYGLATSLLFLIFLSLCYFLYFHEISISYEIQRVDVAKCL
uniref:Uncharacterized protein n=1 Tax=Nelumbo nucifera TaxID=4432 RepID=A0A822YH54_NELNU|nr:TPA_asm: hypothetical protein HUJ06_009460 [Nelumbo nucifera]